MAEETGLKVDYKVVDSVITQLSLMTNNPQDIYISIGRLRQNFSQSNSDCANELKNALDKYEEIYRLLLQLANNSIDMLNMAKIMYSDLDYVMSAELKESTET